MRLANDLLERPANGGEPLLLKFLRRDGRDIDAEVLTIPVGESGDKTIVVQARDVTRRARSAVTVKDRERRLKEVMDTVADGMFTMDEDGAILSFNPAAEAIFGYRAEDVVGVSVERLIPDVRGNSDGPVQRYLGDRGSTKFGTVHGEHVGLRKDGSRFSLEFSVSELWHGEQRMITGVVRDITERTKAEDDLRKARDELEMRVEERTEKLSREVADRRRAEENLRLAAKVIETTNEAVLIADADFRVTSVNPAFTEITGYQPREVIGKAPPFITALESDSLLTAKMWDAIKKQGHWEGELWNKRRNGEDYAERLSISAITDSAGRVQQYAALIGDITKRKQDEERIRHQANYDALTGLPNRTLFLDRLNQSLVRMKRTGKKLGLLFIDLDGFKLVNDTLGHDIGDMLLQEASRRLIDCIRKGDTIARLGGDEFTVIMPDLDDPRNAPMVAQRVLDALAKAFNLAGHETFVSGSIGITIYPDDATRASDLLRNADAAMYRAKDHGKANYQFFTADLNEAVKERLILKNGLVRARDRDEFSLHYQPKLEIDSGRVTGVEALMRWHSHELGSVAPDRFIPVMEESGLAMDIGEWVLRTACAQKVAWRAAGLPAFRVAVNLSARQLREPNFVSLVERVLKDTGVDPEELEIEITENMLMSDTTNTVMALSALHDMGIEVAMDDFGTGYSSLSYLKRFPIDTIKIDRAFIADIATKPGDVEIVKAIITMGHSLNRKVAAEGVETQEQLSILAEYACDELQGYFFCPPLPTERLTTFLQEKATRSARSIRTPVPSRRRGEGKKRASGQ